MTFDDNNSSSTTNARIGMWDPSINMIIWGISQNASSSSSETLNQARLGNCTKMCCKWTLTNLQYFLSIFKEIKI